MMQCRTCSEEKPATTEYFYRATTNVSGLTYRCKSCQGDAQYRNKRTLDPGFIERDRQRAEAQARKACGVKQCSRCSEAKATTAEFWYLKPLKNGTTRPIQPCIVCTRSARLAAAHSSPVHLAWMERRAAKAKRLSDQLAAKLARKELTAVPPGMLWCGRCKAPRPQGDFSPSQRKKGTTVPGVGVVSGNRLGLLRGASHFRDTPMAPNDFFAGNVEPRSPARPTISAKALEPLMGCPCGAGNASAKAPKTWTKGEPPITGGKSGIPNETRS